MLCCQEHLHFSYLTLNLSTSLKFFINFPAIFAVCQSQLAPAHPSRSWGQWHYLGCWDQLWMCRSDLSTLPAREEALPPVPSPWMKGILGFSHTFSSTGPLPLWQLKTRHCLGNRRVMQCLNSFSFYGEPLPYLLHPSSPRAGLFLTFPGAFIILPLKH